VVRVVKSRLKCHHEKVRDTLLCVVTTLCVKKFTISGNRARSLLFSILGR
jgi:hypothetical protein